MNESDDSKKATRIRAFDAVASLVQGAADDGILPTNTFGVFGEFFVIRGTKLYVTGRLRPSGNVTVSNFWAVPD